MKTDLLKNLEAEQSVIGGVLIDNGAFARVGTLPAEAFYHGSHRLIWTAVCGMMAARLPVDVVTVHERLTANDAADAVSLGYLIDLAQNTPSAVNADRYADIVRER